MNTLPTIQDLQLDSELAYKNDQLNELLSISPPDKWVQVHPYIKHRYLPIDKVEYLLRKIFKEFRIEITGQGTSFNGVYVTVRIHFKNPTTGEWAYHDGIGASQLQTKSGTSPADLLNINNGALSMAFPLAKTLAVKDACDHFGNLFGANLNRRDAIDFGDDSLGIIKPIPFELEVSINEADLDNLKSIYSANTEFHTNPKFLELLTKRKTQLNATK